MKIFLIFCILNTYGCLKKKTSQEGNIQSQDSVKNPLAEQFSRLVAEIAQTEQYLSSEFDRRSKLFMELRSNQSHFGCMYDKVLDKLEFVFDGFHGSDLNVNGKSFDTSYNDGTAPMSLILSDKDGLISETISHDEVTDLWFGSRVSFMFKLKNSMKIGDLRKISLKKKQAAYSHDAKGAFEIQRYVLKQLTLKFRDQVIYDNSINHTFGEQPSESGSFGLEWKDSSVQSNAAFLEAMKNDSCSME